MTIKILLTAGTHEKMCNLIHHYSLNVIGLQKHDNDEQL